MTNSEPVKKPYYKAFLFIIQCAYSTTYKCRMPVIQCKPCVRLNNKYTFTKIVCPDSVIITRGNHKDI